MRTRLFLSPSNNTLVGAFPFDAEHIHIVLNSASAPFSVRLPDVKMPEHKEFIFYNIPSSGNGNDVTIYPVDGQKITVKDTSHILSPGDTVTFVADLRNTWLISDINATTVFNIGTLLWRATISGSDLVWQHYEGGIWVEKFRFTV